MQMSYGHVDARVRTWYNLNLDSQYFFVPGIVAFYHASFSASDIHCHHSRKRSRHDGATYCDTDQTFLRS